MKKKFAVVIAVACAACLAVFALSGCNSSKSSKDDAAASSSKASKTFVLGFDDAYPPYGFVGDDGEYTGFDLDLAKEVCKRNGWEFKAEPVDWDAKDAMLNSGSLTCIWNGFTMEGREDKYKFSEPYMLNKQVIVVKSDSGINDFAGLKGKSVMTQVDSAALDVLQDPEGKKAVADTFKDGAPQTIGDYDNAFMQLESGAVQAVACDLSIAQYQIAAKPDVYKQLDEPLSTEHYAVGFAKDNEQDAKVVSDTLKAMYQDGTIETLCKKYEKYGLSYDNWILK